MCSCAEVAAADVVSTDKQLCISSLLRFIILSFFLFVCLNYVYVVRFSFFFFSFLFALQSLMPGLWLFFVVVASSCLSLTICLFQIFSILFHKIHSNLCVCATHPRSFSFQLIKFIARNSVSKSSISLFVSQHHFFFNRKHTDQTIVLFWIVTFAVVAADNFYFLLFFFISIIWIILVS